jgi:hypothetical protein
MQDLKGKPRIFIDKNFEIIHMPLNPETSNPLGKFTHFLNWISLGHIFFRTLAEHQELS